MLIGRYPRAVILNYDLDYLDEEIQKSISQSQEGVELVAEIIRAMKEFSHPDQGEKKST